MKELKLIDIVKFFRNQFSLNFQYFSFHAQHFLLGFVQAIKAIAAPTKKTY